VKKRRKKKLKKEMKKNGKNGSDPSYKIIKSASIFPFSSGVGMKDWGQSYAGHGM